MFLDIILSQNVFGRYLKVHYESVMERPEEETRRIYKFMNTEVTPEVLTFLKDHSSWNG